MIEIKLTDAQQLKTKSAQYQLIYQSNIFY